MIRARFYRVAGMGESDLDQLIAPVYTKYTNPVTTILAAPGDIQMHLRARCETAEEAEALLAEVGPPIEELLGDRIYSRNGDSLEAVVGTLLRERGATLSVAESCTGGMVGERITSVAGSSEYFVGGFLVYSDSHEEECCWASTAQLIERAHRGERGSRVRHGRSRAPAPARPTPSPPPAKPVPKARSGRPSGTVFVGFAGPDVATEARRLQLPGDRARVRTFAAQAALDFLRRKLS